MPDTKHKHSDKRSSAMPVALTIVAVMLLPVLYVLSIGPVLMMVGNDSPTPEWVTRLYFPLEWIGYHIKEFHDLVMWYQSFWR